MSVASDLIRGHTDTIILSLLIIGDSYGYKINTGAKRLWAHGANTTPSPMRDGSSTRKTLPTGNAQGR